MIRLTQSAPPVPDASVVLVLTADSVEEAWKAVWTEHVDPVTAGAQLPIAPQLLIATPLAVTDQNELV